LAERVAIITNHPFSLLNFRGQLIRRLVDRGHTVFTLCPDLNRAQREQIARIGAIPVDISLSRGELNPFADLRDLASLVGHLRRLRPTTTFAFFAKPVIYGTLAGWLARIPRRIAMIEGLGRPFAVAGGASPALRYVILRMYRVALRRAHLVYLLNDQDAADLAAVGAVTPDQVRRIDGIGVDLEKWPFSPPPGDAQRTFVMVARLLKAKGVEDFVSAARRIRSNAPEARFVVVGETDSAKHSLSPTQMRKWVEEGLLEWPGFADPRPYLEAASVFVLPSQYREGLPRSIQEAMATGRAVITTDVPGCRDAVIDGYNGFVVPPGDVTALAGAMRHFLDRPQLVREMGDASRRMAVTRFDGHETASRVALEAGL
jgi:glycosyltransferase involved in cell wall biosynthesis